MKPCSPCLSLLVYLQLALASSFDEECDLTLGGTLHLSFSTPTVCELPPYADLQIQASTVNPNTTFVLFTVQTPNTPVLISLMGDPTLDYAINGSDVGLVSILEVGQGSVEWFLASSWNDSVPVQLLALPYEGQNKSYAPIPGACNQEFNLENEPNLHLSGTASMNITLLEFAPANVGVKRGDSPPVCDVGDDSARFRLTYELYVRHTGSSQFTEEELFAEMVKMATVDGIKKNGQLVKSFKKEDITELYEVNYRSRGSIFNIIVTDPVYGTKAAYVPAIVHPCELEYHSLTCKENIDFGVIVITTFTGLAGLIICLFGHRIFSYEIFFFGFVPFFIGFFMIFGSQVTMSPFVLSAVAAAFGLIGGLIHFGLWWRFGRYLWCMLLVGFNLGFLFSALVFFVTPLENLDTFHNNAIYGLSFTCGVMIIPVLLLFFPKVLSIVASAVWGSFLTFATVSYFTTGIFHYLLYNVMRRAIFEKYAEAHHAVQFEIIDYALFAAWLVLALVGGLIQLYLTRNSPTSFPPCPYQEWKERRRLNRSEPDGRYRQIQTIARHNPTEESPLLRDQIS